MKCVALGVLLLAALLPQSTRSTSAPASRPEKCFFLHGAVDRPGRRPLVDGYTVLDLFADTPSPIGGQIDRAVLIHQDKANPLVFEIDLRRMVLTGDTKSNLRILDADIVYLVRR